MTQKQAVLEHLKRFGSITSWEAIKEYGCTRLSHIIYVLKDNYSISKENVTTSNRFGNNVTYAKYTFIGEKSLT